MSQDSPKMQPYINFPRQKLSDKKKDEKWYKKNVEFAANILVSDYNLRENFVNKRTNYNLRSNIINSRDFEKFINPDGLDLESLPASFQHIGIENSKINLLVGEYSKRRKEYRAYLSASDEEGITRKETELKRQLDAELMEIIQTTSISEEEVQKRLQEFDKYKTYDYQDIAEITANKILKREYKEQDLGFLFNRTFEDLLVGGEQIVYCGVLGGEPVMRRVNPMNLYTMGGNSMFIEDSDIIVEYGYQSVGQVIDDYWDELKEKDVEFLETGASDSSETSTLGLNRDISVFDYYGEEQALSIFKPNEMGLRTFAGAFDTYGNVRVLKASWRSRRKIGKRKYYDEDGEVQYDFVAEDYEVKKDLGEEVKWMWVNEWLQATQIADDIFVSMGPVPFASKSMVNRSKGTPPYIGSVNSTNDYRVQSLTDIIKPLAYSYDIAYYKRELEIATYKGNFAAINASMIPSGWEPKEWIKYATVNKIAWLDPTSEILKGPSQGKSAGAFNTLTATSVPVGDPSTIQLYTNLLLEIEATLGKLAGVTGAREGQIQNREAVGNVNREVTQTSHITEKWFTIDANFRKRAMTKFLECCKFAYKKNPKKGQFLLDDMGQVMVQNFNEFCLSDYDIHISNSTADTELFNELKALSQAAIQNGQATISDLVAISQSESVQEISRKLQDSAEKIKEQQQEMQEKQLQQQQQAAQMAQQTAQAQMEHEAMEAEKDRQVKYADIQAKLDIANMKEIASDVRDSRKDNRDRDSDNNGIDDVLDLRRTDVDENFKNDTISIREGELQEKIRKNKADEAIKRASLGLKKQEEKQKKKSEK
jgi:hypothetical protein